MADKVEKVHRTKRVFINTLDSYASKCIGKFLSTCVVGASVLGSGEQDVDEEERQSLDQRVNEGTFQIVGTCADKNKCDEVKPSYVLEEYFQLKREDLLECLMECDIIIYNITEFADQIEEASWAISAIHAQMDRFSQPKMYILISSVMTWALSKPVDPNDSEIPFTEEDYRRRRAHPNFKEHINVEKVVVKMGKTNSTLFSTYVVASGVQYGMGEQLFHFFFKTSWLGDVPKVPIFGEGTNIIPTIHINDLARVIQNVIDHKPKQHYLLAVDDSKNTIGEILKTIAYVLGPGRTQTVPKEDAFLIRDLSQMDIDALFVNLRIEAVYLKENFNIQWACESGLVENIDRVVDEYKQTRGLLPIRVCILGPPAVGKSTVAERICKHYKLHHIRLKETISETLTHLESAVNTADPEATDSAVSSELLETLRENMNQNGGRLDDQYVIRIMRDKLKSKPCRNQGFVLDGFPKTYEQAKDLFYADDEEPEDMKSQIPLFNKIIPEFVFSLDSSDEVLKDRVLHLPECLVEGTSYSQEQFLRRLASFRESNVEDETVLSYFEELDIHTEHIEITSSDDLEYLLVTERIITSVGKPKNYGATSQEEEEEEEEERRSADRRLKKESQERADTERMEMEEAQQRAARWEEWSKCLEESKKREQDLLEAQSVPLRNYLMKNVMPTLTQGLIECCKTRPQDPVDFLAEYLFRNNPQVE